MAICGTFKGRVVHSNYLKGPGAKNGVWGAWILGCGNFVNTHLWHIFTHCSTSSQIILTQKHLCLNMPSVRSLPWCPILSCTLLSTCSLRQAGNNNWWYWPRWTSSITQYRSPSFFLILCHRFNDKCTCLDKPTFPGGKVSTVCSTILSTH